MRWTDLFAALVAAAWCYLLVSGVDGLFYINAQHVVGYPASGQIVLYAVLPASFLLLIVGVIALSRKARWFYDAYPFAVGLVAFAMLPILMFWTGGV